MVIFCLLVLLNWCFIYKNKSSERRRKIRVGQDKLKQKVLQRMKEQAVETGFPLVLLRALCSSYRLQRRALLGNGIGPVVEPNGTTAAGCSCAVGVAKLGAAAGQPRP